ncbi:flap endonuclease GEN-like 2 [Camellia sinensis]|uniref:flap endonuclease GEN-like 2 n=1 Tax=Camellia sinensis TaxID=4442 RepID=UPI001035A7B4|nr:flap endonuclease GEN-like 2 [Camellia sinensis]
MRLRGRPILSIFIVILFGICVSDEYILPKIAERDLRRFANLRSTSSELGLRLPLDKMPVKCPVSGIIKQRKIQGQDCLEVSWEEMHGLNTSIVPADLIERILGEQVKLLVKIALMSCCTELLCPLFRY